LQEAFGVSKSSAHLLQMGNTKFIFFIIGTFVIDLAILKSVRQLEWNMFKEWLNVMTLALDSWP
jgi:hypothetical protein